jgi:hypothetical protein
MLERERVTAYLSGWPRSAATRLALAMKKSGRPWRSGLSSSMSQAFSSAGTFWPSCAASVASRLGDRRQSRLGLGRRARAGASEIEMIAVEHARLFGRKPEFVFIGVEGVDALEQRLVQIGLAAVAREHWRDCALDRLQIVVGRRAREIEKNARHFVEAAPAAL